MAQSEGVKFPSKQHITERGCLNDYNKQQESNSNLPCDTRVC